MKGFALLCSRARPSPSNVFTSPFIFFLSFFPFFRSARSLCPSRRGLIAALCAPPIAASRLGERCRLPAAARQMLLTLAPPSTVVGSDIERSVVYFTAERGEALESYRKALFCLRFRITERGVNAAVIYCTTSPLSPAPALRDFM